MKIIKPDWQWLFIALLLIVTLTIHKGVRAETFVEDVNFQLDIGQTNVIHKWDDSVVEGYSKDAIAIFKPKMYSVGLTAWHKSDIGVRIAYGFMNEARDTYGGDYKHISILFEYIASVEIMYRVHLPENAFLNGDYIYGGLGKYWIPTNQYYEGIDPDSHSATDRDDDDGFFIGYNKNINTSIGIDIRATSYSRIGGYENIKGISLTITYLF